MHHAYCPTPHHPLWKAHREYCFVKQGVEFVKEFNTTMDLLLLLDALLSRVNAFEIKVISFEIKASILHPASILEALLDDENAFYSKKI